MTLNLGPISLCLVFHSEGKGNWSSPKLAPKTDECGKTFLYSNILNPRNQSRNTRTAVEKCSHPFSGGTSETTTINVISIFLQFRLVLQAQKGHSISNLPRKTESVLPHYWDATLSAKWTLLWLIILQRRLSSPSMNLFWGGPVRKWSSPGAVPCPKWFNENHWSFYDGGQNFPAVRRGYQV